MVLCLRILYPRSPFLFPGPPKSFWQFLACPLQSWSSHNEGSSFFTQLRAALSPRTISFLFLTRHKVPQVFSDSSWFERRAPIVCRIFSIQAWFGHLAAFWFVTVSIELTHWLVIVSFQISLLIHNLLARTLLFAQFKWLYTVVEVVRHQIKVFQSKKTTKSATKSSSLQPTWSWRASSQLNLSTLTITRTPQMTIPAWCLVLSSQAFIQSTL